MSNPWPTPKGTVAGQPRVSGGVKRNPVLFGVALTQWDYQGILAHNTVVTAANGGIDLYGNAITDVAQGGGRVDDGVSGGSDAPLKPGYGWHLSETTPPSPGNRIELALGFDASKDWTLESWMNPGNSTADGRVIMFAHNDNISAETFVVEWVLFGNAVPDAVTLTIDDENAVLIFASGNITIPALVVSRWYHCAVTYDSINEQYNVFFDGNRIGQSPLLTAATDPFDAVGHVNNSPSDNGAWTETRLSRGLRYTTPTYAIPATPFIPD